MNEGVQRYFDSVPAERKPVFEKLQALILSLCPDAEVVMWYRVPTYRAKSGWVALAYHRNHVSLYTDRVDHIAELKAKHPATKTGKGCISFRDGDPFPVADLKKVIRHAMEDVRWH